MNSLNIVCFSKDRPMQLQAYIESLDKYADLQYTLDIIYTVSDEKYEQAYKQLMATYDDIPFIRETNMQKNLRDLFNGYGEHVMFGCDDVLFTSKFGNEYETLMIDENVFGFTMRAGENIIYSHPAQTHFKFHGEVIEDTFCKWDWRTGQVTFAYPFELNATVYRKQDVLKYFDLVKGVKKWHPNILEGGFYSLRQYFYNRPIMYSYKNPKMVVLTINRVQDVAENPVYEEEGYTTEKLLEMFLAGRQIDIDHLHDRTFDRIHIGEFKFKQL